MKNLHVPFRYDYVGSFLRPEKLKEARASFAAGTISRDALTSAENSAIEELIGKQKAAGYHVITDGEFRRQATAHTTISLLICLQKRMLMPSISNMMMRAPEALIRSLWFRTTRKSFSG